MCLIQEVFSNEICSHGRGLFEEQKRLSSVRLLLLKACGSIPAHIEENYRVPGLHVYFSVKATAAQLKASVN